MKIKIFSLRNLPAERGGAMVELVVLMLVFVPLILLPLYFQDAVHFKLNAQEAIYSSAWDFAYGDYEKKSVSDLAGSIRSENWEIFKNGHSGDKKDKVDGPWANFKWESSGKVATCAGEKDFEKPLGKISKISIIGQFHKKYTNGGLVDCKGAIMVENRYIPQKFLPEFTKNNNTDMFIKKNEWIKYTDKGDAYAFGVVVDPWTIHNAKSIEDGSDNDPFMERSNFCWKRAATSAASFLLVVGKWAAFMKKVKDLVLSVGSVSEPYYLAPNKMKDITSLHPIKSTKTRDVALGGQNKFWVSPFKDGKQNTYEKTYNKRDGWYLGCKSAIDGNGNCE